MKTTLLTVATALTASLVLPSAFGAVVYNDTITYINGAGNPNTGWVSDTDNGILLGVRADDRSTGATPNNGAGIYSFLPGTVPSSHGPVADWNYQFTINSDPADGSVKLDAYNYYLTLSINGGPASAPVNVLTGFPDSTYGNNSSTQGNGVVIGSPATDALLGTEFNVAANSESITFLGLPNNGGIYDFDLYATAGSASAPKLDDVSMEVQVVPESSTIIAGASMLLPFGTAALGMLRKRKTA